MYGLRSSSVKNFKAVLYLLNIYTVYIATKKILILFI
jgi:hypothetical protein